MSTRVIPFPVKRCRKSTDLTPERRAEAFDQFFDLFRAMIEKKTGKPATKAEIARVVNGLLDGIDRARAGMHDVR